MIQNNMQKQLVEIVAVLIALGAVTAAHAITQPIQTQHGVVRLGSKTQAGVDANHSSVAIGQGMVLASSNPGGLGRATLKVSFGGAPMVAKVQGTAVIAYLPGRFIEITEVEGRTYLTREGKLGENMAIDAGKMLLVKPTANRLPNTADINLGNLVKNSPMLNGGLNLAASPLIARAVEKQSKDRYLKATPIYFDGAGTVALVDGGRSKLPSSAGYESTPLDSSLAAIYATGQIPRSFASVQVVASVASSPGGEQPGGGGPPGGGQPGGGGPPGGGQPGGGGPPGGGQPGGGGPSGPSLVDLAGQPDRNWTLLANNQLPATRGFLEEFILPGNTNQFWFPVGFPKDQRDQIMNNAFFPGETQIKIPTTKIVKVGAGFMQGALATGGTADVRSFLIFPETKVNNDPTFTVTPVHGVSQIELRVSNEAVPSDLLTKNEFRLAFANLVQQDPEAQNFTAKLVHVGFRPSSVVSTVNQDIDGPVPFPPLQDNPLGMKIEVPPQSLKYTWNGFFDPAHKPTTPAPTTPNTNGEILPDPGQLLGLTKDTLLGSVFVRVTGGEGVRVQDRAGFTVGSSATTDDISHATPFPGNRTGDRLTFLSADTGTDNVPGLFSVQAPPTSTPPTGPKLKVESDGPLHISDPTFDPTTNTSALTGVALISKQDIIIEAVALPSIDAAKESKTVITNLNNPPTVTLNLSSVKKLTVGLDYWIRIDGTNPQITRVNLQKINTDNTAVFAFYDTTIQSIPANSLIFDQDPSLHGQLVFNNTNLKADQGITVSSANKIQFENSSQIQALTDIVMQGGKTADLEFRHSAATTDTKNGHILLDQFRNITIDSAQLIAAVIRARVVSPTGVLMINNSTLTATSLLHLYAEGSSGKVVFSGNVNLTGKRIDIAGKTVEVQLNGNVLTSPNTTVYADTRNYNTSGSHNTSKFGTINISSSQQKSFGDPKKPSF
jgi:hypothetical protein